MVRLASTVVSAALLACVCGAPAFGQPDHLDPFSPDFTDQVNAKVQAALQRVQDGSEVQEKIQEAMEKAQQKAEEASQKAQEKMQDKMFAFQDGPGPKPMPSVSVKIPPMPVMPIVMGGDSADALYQQVRDLIDRERYDMAMRRINDLLQRYDNKPKAVDNRVDATLYWKAYTLGKEQQIPEALNTLADMQKRFADSRWSKDAKALELELRQASGQSVSPDAQNDEELKLLALRGVMRSDPDRAVPMVEQLLNGNSSIHVKENALFVLSQSQAPRAKDIITNTAKNGSNPDLQLKAIRYLGAMRTADAAQTLGDIYKSSNDASVKRAIIQAMVSTRNPDKLAEIARSEKDTDLRRNAIRNLGAMRAPNSTEVLRSLYASETAPEVKKEIINALYVQRDAAALVAMARAEKDPAMKKEIVTRLSTMNAKEATDYMLELLK